MWRETVNERLQYHLLRVIKIWRDFKTSLKPSLYVPVQNAISTLLNEFYDLPDVRKASDKEGEVGKE